MSDNFPPKDRPRSIGGRVRQALDTVGQKTVSLRRRITEKAVELKASLMGQEITVYPTYGYCDLKRGGWIVPMRVWVHDNRDTPFVEEMVERLAVRYFEKDLQRPLVTEEKVRLQKCLAPFIADDKNNESVEFTFEDDLDHRQFVFEHPTSPNGIIEEPVWIPDGFVRQLQQLRNDASPWLRIRARTKDGNGAGSGTIRLLSPEGVSIISDIDDTVKVTGVPVGQRSVLRATFLEEFRAAIGMQERYLRLIEEAGEKGDVCFHYVSGSPWQLYEVLREFLMDREHFPPGTFHMKNFRKNMLETGALETIRSFAIGGDLATLDQKVRQITTLLAHLPKRRFILVGDSGEKDPEVYRAIQRIFTDQIQKIIIRDVLGERLNGMERISGAEVALSLDTSELEAEMTNFVAQTRAALEQAVPS